MRWPAPREMDARVVRKFLWLPMEIDGEVRWWEMASWVEYYRRGRDGHFWKPERWM